jgi:hypothetical protein
MTKEGRRDKWIRNFQRGLSEDEIKSRLDSTKEVILELCRLDGWKDYITGIRVFGSMITGGGKNGFGC